MTNTLQLAPSPGRSPSTRTLVRGGRTSAADGTTITYLARGEGPVVLGVHGGLGSAISMPITYPLPDIAYLEHRVAAGDCEQLLLDITPAAGGFSTAELAALHSDPLWMSKIAHAPTLVPTMRIMASLPAAVDRHAALTCLPG
ncbi:hypothetical protein [Nocardia niwae]|uniref:Alpha/beta hydrolase n=1 Tax=Nocardia niwae TaxID=626084 RepID=A0ABV2X9D8_9NOCA